MRAVTWQGRYNVEVQETPDPKLENSRDAVVEVTSCAVCGSDLHLYHGLVPRMERGDVLGHEAAGVVREVGEDVTHVQEGDRVVVPFPIACGECVNCRNGKHAACLTTNHGHGAAIFGYSHLYGGIPGGQAELLRVPYADTGLFKLPQGVTDEQGVFLADVLPTGYEAVAAALVGPESTVAVYGAGPVGLMTVLSAKKLLGARKIVAIDRVPERLRLARELGADVTVNFESDTNSPARVREHTDGIGADVAVDAVGFEASSPKKVVSTVEKAAGALLLQAGSLTALRYAVDAVRWGGVLSVPGVYAQARAQMFPWGPIWEKNVAVTLGQTHVHAHLPTLIEAVESGKVDPTRIVTHRTRLEDAPRMYETFDKKEDGCVKVLLSP